MRRQAERHPCLNTPVHKSTHDSCTRATPDRHGVAETPRPSGEDSRRYGRYGATPGGGCLTRTGKIDAVFDATVACRVGTGQTTPAGEKRSASRGGNWSFGLCGPPATE